MFREKKVREEDEEEVNERRQKERKTFRTHRPTTRGLPSSVIRTRAVSSSPLEVAMSAREVD